MKKLHLLVGVFIFIGCLQVHAEKSRVAMEKWQTGKEKLLEVEKQKEFLIKNLT